MRNACHGLPEAQRPRSCARSGARRIHDPVTPSELLANSHHSVRGYSSSAVSELAGGLLHGICLLGVDLGGANFQNADLTQAQFLGCDLWGADFRGADLRGAYFHRSQLTRASFLGAKLDGTSFIDSILDSSDFEAADLRKVDLQRAYLRHANLTKSDMRGALLTHADLTSAKIGGARFDDTRFDGTLLIDLDVTPIAASKPIHTGQSSADYRTIIHSMRSPNIKHFLRSIGMPWVFIEYMLDCAHSTTSEFARQLMQSTFISYGGPDEKFARKLYEALSAREVVTFFFPETSTVGERINTEVYRKIQEHDRVLLICSKESMNRVGVVNEIQETLDREAKEGAATLLLPIMLDDYVLTGWKERYPDLAERIGRRIIADFRGAKRAGVKFDRAVDRVIDALKKERPTNQ